LIVPDSTIPGFTALLAAVLFIGGVQLLSIGLLGEYVGRIYSETKRRPLYVVDELITADGSADGSAHRQRGPVPADRPDEAGPEPDSGAPAEAVPGLGGGEELSRDVVRGSAEHVGRQRAAHQAQDGGHDLEHRERLLE